MNIKRWNKVRGLILALVPALILMLALPPITQAAYKYTELVPSGWISASLRFSISVNASGVVVGGGLDGSGKWKGFIYNRGTYTELLPPGWDWAGATGINNSGGVVGYGIDGSGLGRGFIYSGGTYTELGGFSAASGINDGGDVVGAGGESCYNNNCLVINGFIYSEGTYTLLLPPNWTNSWATAINDNGVAVGYGEFLFSDTYVRGGFIYIKGVYTVVLPPGWFDASLTGINENGVVVGNGQDANGKGKGFIYSGGSYTELVPPGWISSAAWGINDSGVVVGGGLDGSGKGKGFIFSRGTYTELLPPGWKEAVATSINNSGVVVGWGKDIAGKDKGFIAIPPPEQLIDRIREFFDDSITNGSLTGLGPTANSASGRLNVLQNMLEQAEYLIHNGFITEACQQLLDTYKKTDGNPNPPDFVTGTAASELAAMIQYLMTTLGCP